MTETADSAMEENGRKNTAMAESSTEYSKAIAFSCGSRNGCQTCSFLTSSLILSCEWLTDFCNLTHCQQEVRGRVQGFGVYMQTGGSWRGGSKQAYVSSAGFLRRTPAIANQAEPRGVDYALTIVGATLFRERCLVCPVSGSILVFVDLACVFFAFRFPFCVCRLFYWRLPTSTAGWRRIFFMRQTEENFEQRRSL